MTGEYVQIVYRWIGFEISSAACEGFDFHGVAHGSCR